ncbi:CinA family protein [Thiohalorhabdus sp.]|uniref:CinA family protein n=1 Tax=Thiohalorhabdus sp. TaxID=3094134 RepID=UPI002FC30542
MNGTRVEIRTPDPLLAPWEAGRAARVRAIAAASEEVWLEVAFAPGQEPRHQAVALDGRTVADWRRSGGYLTIRLLEPELAERATVAALAAAGADPRRSGRCIALAADGAALQEAAGPGARLREILPGEWWLEGAEGETAWPGMDPELRSPEDQVGARLAEAGLAVAAAESCTAGALAERLTAIPGSSGYVDRGWVTYTNDAKAELLGVSEADLAEHGAVSQPVAEAMVRGALAGSAADLALAVTGVAGPGGGTVDKPVGTVWIGAGHRDGEPLAHRFAFSGGRSEVRWRSVNAALGMACELVS